MKKLICVALLAASLSEFAQEAKKGGSEKMLETMTTELSLTADQQAKLKPILDQQVALKNDSKANPANAEANKEKGKELSKQIKGILTPEQFEKQKALREKAKAEGKKEGAN